jgi:hypothetical protein
MNRRDRRRAARLLGCASAYQECELTGLSLGHRPEDCDGSCHTSADLSVFEEKQMLRNRDYRARIDFVVAATYLAAELEAEPRLVRGMVMLLSVVAASSRAVAALCWRLLTAFLTYAGRRAELFRLVLEARFRRYQALSPRLLACLDQTTSAPRTGPPAGRTVACLASGGALA